MTAIRKRRRRSEDENEEELSEEYGVEAEFQPAAFAELRAIGKVIRAAFVAAKGANHSLANRRLPANAAADVQVEVELLIKELERLVRS